MTLDEVTRLASLSDRMEFDHVVKVKDGIVGDANNLYAPELFDNLDGTYDLDEGWRLMNGYSGQDRYSGPIMHASEYIGGGMARDILASDGYYVALVAYCPHSCEHCGETVYEGADGRTVGDNESTSCESSPDGEHLEDDDNVSGWAVAYRPLEVE